MSPSCSGAALIIPPFKNLQQFSGVRGERGGQRAVQRVNGFFKAAEVQRHIVLLCGPVSDQWPYFIILPVLYAKNIRVLKQP
ncbi:MAG: hypothetical protein A2049_00965 [Elusimicrobia bacterium GWA2_62_23]|nr:MAG: hypothetical protein A2049_00965 [Elusimicrobia bacterium GWA2_62_23]